MKWRMLLAALLGLLLPLPLVWLLYLAAYGGSLDVPRSEGSELVPMLSREERQRLPTYERDCRTDTDCDSPLRCFFNMRSQASYCTDSTCVTDAQCPDGFACRILSTKNDRDLVRVCSLMGVRQEGEQCVLLPSTREYGCERGLLCKGRCGRPCQLENPASCPEGFFCEDGLEGPSCLPSCAGRTCPEGQRCVDVDRDRGVSICAEVRGQNCQRHSCPEGQRCMLYTYPQRVDTVWMECLLPCGSSRDTSVCPTGTVCDLYRCRQRCTPEDPSSCEPGFACARRTPKDPWTCVPD